MQSKEAGWRESARAILAVTGRTLALLDATPGWHDLATAAGLDHETTTGILAQAARFADDRLVPLGLRADREGCRLEGGNVLSPSGYAETLARMGRDGWLAIDLPEALGGQGLPLALHAAAAPLFEGAATAFMMAAGASRPAAHLLAATAPDHAAAWAPRLAAGKWAASICISEPDAGSDVGRIRTRAEPDGDTWRITGEKCWISFGAHDMTDRIGHLLLARTGPREAGTRGLSLFLVPDRLDDGTGNAVACTRIEEKMGLHGSPTCALSFEGAAGHLIGEPGRGLPALFTMIRLMRLQCATHGAGIARRATRIARRYAAERRQGGDPAAPPVPIDTHADIRRRLADLDARTTILEAFVLEVAVTLDRAATDPDAALVAPLLLPLAKNFGAETAYTVASDAILILGGAGYSRDWPLEQLVRDARVIAIYEGTTGMQAQDFLHRNLLRDGGRANGALHARIEAELAAADSDICAAAAPILARFRDLSRDLLAGAVPPDLAADGYLRAGWTAVSAWMACRVSRVSPALARFRLHQLGPEMAAAEAACRIPPQLLDT